MVDLAQLTRYCQQFMSNTVDSMANLAFSPASPHREWPRNTSIRATMARAANNDAQPPLDEYFDSLFTALSPAVGKNWCRKRVAECEKRPLGQYLLEEGR